MSSLKDVVEDTNLNAANLQYGSIGQALYEQLPAFLKQQKRGEEGRQLGRHRRPG